MPKIGKENDRMRFKNITNREWDKPTSLGKVFFKKIIIIGRIHVKNNIKKSCSARLL